MGEATEGSVVVGRVRLERVRYAASMLEEFVLTGRAWEMMNAAEDLQPGDTDPLPEGSVVVDRARFARLLVRARIADEIRRMDPWLEDDAGGLLDYREGTFSDLFPDLPELQPCDLDPLPE